MNPSSAANQKEDEYSKDKNFFLRIVGMIIQQTVIILSVILISPTVILSGESEDPYVLFQMAEQACKAYNLSRAFEFLKEAFEEGYTAPSKVLSNKNFRPLRESPEYRRHLRSLLRKHIRETEITMIDSEEEGEKMIILGKLVRSDSTPVADAILYFYHTDNKGLYAPEHLRGGFGSNNPRLFGYVKTNEKGEFKITTIHPNSYPGYRNLRHVHFEIIAPNCNQISQFYLDKDPEPTPTQIREAKARDFPILTAITNTKGDYEVHSVRMCR